MLRLSKSIINNEQYTLLNRQYTHSLTHLSLGKQLKEICSIESHSSLKLNGWEWLVDSEGIFHTVKSESTESEHYCEWRPFCEIWRSRRRARRIFNLQVMAAFDFAAQTMTLNLVINCGEMSKFCSGSDSRIWRNIKTFRIISAEHRILVVKFSNTQQQQHEQRMSVVDLGGIFTMKCQQKCEIS